MTGIPSTRLSVIPSWCPPLSVVAILLGISSSLPVPGAGEEDLHPKLSTLRAHYRKALREATVEVERKYIAALEESKGNFTRSGQLEFANQAAAEIERIKAGPAKEAKFPDMLFGKRVSWGTTGKKWIVFAEDGKAETTFDGTVEWKVIDENTIEFGRGSKLMRDAVGDLRGVTLDGSPTAIRVYDSAP